MRANCGPIVDRAGVAMRPGSLAVFVVKAQVLVVPLEKNICRTSFQSLQGRTIRYT